MLVVALVAIGLVVVFLFVLLFEDNADARIALLSDVF